MCYLCLKRLEESTQSANRSPQVQHLPDPWVTTVFSNPTSQHSTAQHSSQCSLLRGCQYLSQLPNSERSGRKYTWRGGLPLAIPFEYSRREQTTTSCTRIKHASGHRQTSLKSTSEVTLQDSNLEVYWQRGKRSGLVHGRGTFTGSPAPSGWALALCQNRVEGEEAWGREDPYTTSVWLHLIFVRLEVGIS